MACSRINSRAKTVLSIADVPGGHTLSMVELVDGRLGIFIDAKLSSLWEQGEIEDCMNAFLARKWELQQRGSSVRPRYRGAGAT